MPPPCIYRLGNLAQELGQAIKGEQAGTVSQLRYMEFVGEEVKAQEIWDRTLILGWESDSKLTWFVHRFVEEVAPILNKLGDFRRKLD